MTLTQATLSNPKINVTNRSSGLASKGPVARAPMKTRTSTVMSASLNVGAQSKMRAGGAVAQIGSVKSKLSHVVSAYGKNTTTKASRGQFGSSGSSVQSSRTQLTNSNNVQTKKFNFGQTNMVTASLNTMNSQSKMRNVTTRASTNNIGSDFSIGGSRSFPV